MNRFGGLVAATCTIGLLSACSVSTGDFRDEAQKFIESDEVEGKLDLAFSGAVCAEPTDTDPDTSFTCTATGADGVTYSFQVTITGDSEFELNSPEPVG